LQANSKWNQYNKDPKSAYQHYAIMQGIKHSCSVHS